MPTYRNDSLINSYKVLNEDSEPIVVRPGETFTTIYDYSNYSQLTKTSSSPGIMFLRPEGSLLMDYVHYMNHKGKNFFYTDYVTKDTDQSIVYSWVPEDDGEWVSIFMDIEGTSQLLVEIFEGVEVSGGSEITPRNNNRNSTINSIFTVKKDVTLDTEGTRIFVASKGLAGSPPRKADLFSKVPRNRELILKKGEAYALRITSKDDGNIISLLAEWSEDIG